MTDLIQLAERCEKAGADEQWRLLLRAYAAVFGQQPSNDTWYGRTVDEYIRGRYFINMLHNRAFESAALMLLPEHVGHWPQLYTIGTNPNNPTVDRERAELWVKGRRTPFRANANTPALAIAAAALKARAGETQNGGA